MPNTFFRFKQFTVQQGGAAMKVCTDACLFGALAPLQLEDGRPIRQVLDIGTGTGLLALMYAQRQPQACIDAVEIEAGAAKQAEENFRASPFAARLQLVPTPVQDFQPGTTYQLVLCNPPFYEQALHSPSECRNLALHSTALDLDTLLAHASRLLAPEGLLYLLLPFHRAEACTRQAAAHQLFLYRQTRVQQTPAHPFFRSLLLFGRYPKTVADTATVIIKDAAQQYTPAFAAALKAFYLYL